MAIKDVEIIVNTLHVWFNLTEKVDAQFEEVVKEIPVKDVIQCLSHDTKEIQFEALQLIGNLCMGTQKVADRLLETNALSLVVQSLSKEQTEEWRQECYFLLSNVACGASRNVQRLLACGAVQHICDYLAKPQTPMSVSNPSSIRGRPKENQ